MIKKIRRKDRNSLVVSPVQLPVAVSENRKRFSFTRFMGQTFLTCSAAIILGGAVCIGFSIYHLAYTPRLVKVTPKFFKPVNPAPLPVIEHMEPTYAENVVAVVGGEEITIEEVQDFVKEVPQLSEVPFEQVYPKMLELLINNKVVKQGADDLGIPENATIQKMIQAAQDQIIMQAYLTYQLDQSITDDDLNNLYQEQVQAFQPVDEIHARHILLGTEDQARDTMIQLQAGADFTTLAQQKSLDRNAPDGDLGYFTKEMMIPEFAEAVFKMHKGEISQPVHTPFGWHIIQVEDRRQTVPPSFDSQKEQLRQMVMEKKLPDILNQERSKREVKILKPTLTEK